VDDPGVPHHHQRLVVTLGRLGDIYGRVRMYNLGFAVFTFFSLLLSVTWMTGAAGWHLAHRDAHLPGRRRRHAHGQLRCDPHRRLPEDQRGLALGINQAAAFSGTFIGLILGGSWPRSTGGSSSWSRCPSGSSPRCGATCGCASSGSGARPTSTGRATPRSPLGLVLIMIGITYGIEPYGGHAMGWTSPPGARRWPGSAALLIAFCVIEVRVREPMFRLQLFKIRAFTSGVVASFLAALSRGGLMFMLIIWLQGIWLPLHGYAFATTRCGRASP
jgi:MFS family permease